MPKGYWGAKAHIYDLDKLKSYGNLAEKVIEKFGGIFLVRGGCLLYTSPSPRD